EPDFAGQVLVAGGSLFKEAIPSLGIDPPDGRDEELSDSLGLGLHESPFYGSSSFRAPSAPDLSDGWENYSFSLRPRPGWGCAAGDGARPWRRPSARRRSSGRSRRSRPRLPPRGRRSSGA